MMNHEYSSIYNFTNYIYMLNCKLMKNQKTQSGTLFNGSETPDVVLRAAMTRFSSYGYKRTSMEDIAKEARVSRPTLYAYFKNKEAILRNVSEGIHDSALTAIESHLAAKRPLAERLHRSFWAWSQPFMDILFGSAHGAELIGASSAMASDVSDQARERFLALLTTALETARKDGELDLKTTRLSAAKAAEFLVLSLNGLSTGEADERTYKSRLKVLVTVFLTATSPKETP